jgi:FixJ family two-component response regulator
MSEESTVFVVDDDPAICKSLSWLIESVGLPIQTYHSAQQFLDAYDPDLPGCLILDVRMPGMSGLDLQDKLRQMDVEIPIILVTGYGDVPMAVRAMKHGAIDFIEKPVSDQVLLDHIWRAIELDTQQRRQRAGQLVIRERIERLTPREREVMNLIIAGKSSKEIAAEQAVSFKTVEGHRASIMKKMQAKGMPNLVHMTLSLSKKPTEPAV